MFDPLPIKCDKHVCPVPSEPIIGSFIPVQREGGDHSLCTFRYSDGVWVDDNGFVCSRCTHKRGVPTSR